MPSLPVMILEGNPRTTLGVVRSLGRRGIPIFVGSSQRVPKSGVSRYVTRRFYYPSAGSATPMHETILEHVRAWRPAVLLPTGGDEWGTVYRHEREYEEATRIVPTPRWALFERLDEDKSYLTSLAQEHGVPIPKTYLPRTIDEALELLEELPYPVLIKPARGTGGVGVRVVDDAQTLSRLLKAGGPPPCIQEFMGGEEVELTILCEHGEPLAGSAYRPVRHYPLPFGPTTAAVTVRDEAVMAEGIRFLRRLAYHGVAHMDFRRDPRDGVAKLIDFTPSLTGTNDASLASGVDFGWSLYRMALGERLQPDFTYEVGMEYRWLLYGELLHLLATPHKLQAVRAMWPHGRVRTNVSLRDPLPHLAEGITLTRRRVANWWKRRTRGRRTPLGKVELS